MSESNFTTKTEFFDIPQKQIKTLLNLERFGLLDEKTAQAVQEEREAGRYPAPLVPVSAEEFQEYKDLMSMFVGKVVANTDRDFAALWYGQERASDFLTDKEVKKEIGAIVGGIIAPTIVPYVGQATLLPRVAAITSRYPRVAKIFAAFLGGTGGSYPVSDDIMEAMGYGVREMAGEGAFQGISKAWPWLKKAFRGKDKKNLEDGAEATLKLAEKEGSTITPARLSKSKLIDLMENFAEVSFFGSQVIKDAGEEGLDAVQKQLAKFLNKEFLAKGSQELVEAESKIIQSFLKTMAKEDMDLVLKSFLTKGSDFYEGAINGAYKALNKQVIGTVGNAKIIDITNLERVLENNLRTIYIKGKGNKAVVPDEGPIQSVINYIKKIKKENPSGKIDFNSAKSLRTFLLNKTGYYVAGGTTADKSSNLVASNLLDAVTKNMDKSIKELAKNKKYSPDKLKEIKKLYKDAASLFKQGKETFNTKFITGLLLGDKPGVTKAGLDISDALFENFVKSGKPGRIKQFYKLIDDAVAKKIITSEASDLMQKKLQGQFIFSSLAKAFDVEKNTFNAGKVLADISSFKGAGSGIIETLFKNNKKGLALFENYIKSVSLAQKRGIGSQQGGLAMFSGQTGAAAKVIAFLPALVAGAGSGGVGATTLLAGAGSALLLLLGPGYIAKKFADPKFVNNLMNMQMAKSGTNSYARSVISIINSFVSDGAVDIFKAKEVINEGLENEIFNDEDIKSLDWFFESKDPIGDEDIIEKEKEIKANEIDTDQNFLDEINGEAIVEETVSDRQPGLEEAVTTEEVIDIPEPNTEMMSTEVIQPLSSPAGMPFDPEMSTTDKLEEVGLPVFANKGGIMSLMEQRKPKQMVA